MKNFIYTLTVFLFAGSLILTGQSYTTFEQVPADSSDYYINFNWEINTTSNLNCSCVPPSSTSMSIGREIGFIQYENVFNTSNPQNNPWSGIAATTWHPGQSATYLSFITNNNSMENSGNMSCVLTCNYSNTSNVVVASTQPLKNGINLDLMRSDTGSAILTWDVITDIPNNLYNLVVYKNNIQVETLNEKSTTSWQDPCPAIGDVYGIQTYYNAGSSSTSTSISDVQFTQQIYDSNIPFNSISGTVVTLSCNGESGVIIKATLMNPAEISNGNCWPQEYTTMTTGSSGNFQIPNIYRGVGSDMAEYALEAFLPASGGAPAHSFRIRTAGAGCPYNATDSVRTIILSSTNQSPVNQSFVDITSFVINGNVSSMGPGFNTCGLEGVTIQEAPPGNSGIAPVETDQDGNFSLVVPEGNKTYQIMARYGFNFGSIPDSVKAIAVGNTDVAGHEFIHTESYEVSGFIGAGCQENIGQASLEIRDERDSCTLVNITTNSSGFYTATLPARPLHFEVTGINLLPGSGLTDEAVVVSGFGGADTILLDTMIERDFIYRRPLSVEILGLPESSCAAIANPILVKGRTYGMGIRVTEGENCPIDTGSVVIANSISGNQMVATKYDTIPISNGLAVYQFKSGDPNFFGNHLKSMAITAKVGEEIESITINAVVTGATQSGNNFMTSAPTELPLLILRDPPGDQSYAEWSQTNTTTIGQTFSTKVGGGVNIWTEASTGTEFFGLEIWGQIGGSINISGSKTTQEEFVFEMANTQTFKTSDANNVIGEAGDVFVGASYNFIYSLADRLSFDLTTCALEKDRSLIMSPDSFATTFAYSESWIRGEDGIGVIPNLQLTVDDVNQPDSVRYRAANSIKLWEQVLQLNVDLKKDALRNGTNYSFDGNLGEFGEEVVSTKTEKRTIEFITQVDIGIAVEAGFEFKNNGLTAGVDVSIQTEIGEVESTEVSTSTATSYWIDDANAGDAFSIDIATDPVFATPVFKTRAGQSSCPHEEGTVKRDNHSMLAINQINNVADPNGTAVFNIQLVNNSTLPGARLYKIGFNSGSNDGATVTLAGNPSNVDDEVPVSPGIQNYFFTVERINGSTLYAFEGLEFYMYPACFDNYLVADNVSKVLVSAYFDNPCSNIDMSAPLDNWLVNSSANDEIEVTMSGYDLSNNFDGVVMQYSLVGTNSWQTSNISKNKSELLAGSTTSVWDVSNVADGQYYIRFKLNCGLTISYSNRIIGIIDREGPRLFGIERPVNDLYAPGKEISVTLDEQPNLVAYPADNYYLISLPDSTYWPVTIQVNENDIEFIPLGDISENYNQLYEVGLINLPDMYDNMHPDSISWKFVISEPDSDQDGIPDTKDRCPGGDDSKDTDMDGLPDDCDCVPTIKTNGRALTKAAMGFDGIDDQIVIPHNSAFDPVSSNSFTFEAWVKPDTGTIAQTILSKGHGGSGATSYIFSLYQNKIALFIGDGTTATWIYSDTDVKFNEWMHVAVSYNHLTNSFTFYMNGEFDGNKTISHGFYSNSSPLYIGRQGQNCNCNFFKGQMEEVRIWDQAKTETQIQDNLNKELLGSEVGLIAYYDMNEGTPFGSNVDLSNLIDNSGNGHNGTMNTFAKSGNASNWVNSPMYILGLSYDLCMSCPDTINAAMDFDGVDDQLVIPHDPAFNPGLFNSFTFEAFVKANAGQVSQTILSKGHGANGNTSYIFSLYQNKVALFIGDGITANWIYSDSDVTFDEWMHVAVSYDHLTSSFTFYRNGEFDGNRPILNDFTTNTSPVYIGRQGQSCNCNFYKGQMDDIRFWSTARTPAQIADNLYTELVGDENGLIAYYDFNNGMPDAGNETITIVSDVTGNGNDAVLENFYQFGMFSNWVESPLHFGGDEDEDGRPDICDDCIPEFTLTLDNQFISGTYIANDKIILGNNLMFDQANPIYLRAPEVEVLSSLDVDNAEIYVSDKPCNE